MASDTGDVPSGTAGDISGDITWMSYAELGRARGISPASAKRLAIRRHWRRQLGNDQQARVAVPVMEAVTPAVDRGDDTSVAAGDIARVVSGFEAALTVLREQLQGAEQRAEAAEQGREAERLRADEALALANQALGQLAVAAGLADRTLAQLADAQAALTAERARADQVEARERDRGDRLERDLAAALTAADASHQRAQDAHQALEALRAGRTMPGRRGACWRGSGRPGGEG